MKKFKAIYIGPNSDVPREVTVEAFKLVYSSAVGIIMLQDVVGKTLASFPAQAYSVVEVKDETAKP